MWGYACRPGLKMNTMAALGGSNQHQYHYHCRGGHYYYTGKNPTYAQVKIKLFARQHGVLRESCFLLFTSEMKNKEYHHGGFQQQSPRRLVDINEHIDSRNDC